MTSERRRFFVQFEGRAIELPRLPGWLTVMEAGEILGIRTKQGMHRLMWETCEFLFDEDPDKSEIIALGDRPMWIIRETAVNRLRDLRLENARRSLPRAA